MSCSDGELYDSMIITYVFVLFKCNSYLLLIMLRLSKMYWSSSIEAAETTVSSAYRSLLVLNLPILMLIFLGSLRLYHLFRSFSHFIIFFSVTVTSVFFFKWYRVSSISLFLLLYNDCQPDLQASAMPAGSVMINACVSLIIWVCGLHYLGILDLWRFPCCCNSRYMSLMCLFFFSLLLCYLICLFREDMFVAYLAHLLRT